MSFILDAFERVEELRGRKTAALSRAATIPPPAARQLPRRTLLRIGLVGLGACALAYGTLHWRQHAIPGAAASRPRPALTAAEAASQTLASADIPTMVSSAEAARAPREPAASAPSASTARASKVRVVAVRKPAKFTPPATLAQPLPTPSPSVPLAERGKVPPLPLTGLSEAAPAASAAAPPDDMRPLSALPLELQALVHQMKVRVLLYAPLRRSRFVLIDGRQLREGDELFAGLRLHEITQAGMVLQHNGIRVLAQAPTGR